MRTLLAPLLVLAAGTVASASVGGSLHDSPPSAFVWWTVIRIVLLAGFLFATVTAFKIPGTGIPELAALLMLSALLAPAIIRGDAQWYELALIAGGLALLGIEIFVIPGFGATGIGGIVLLAVGFLLAFLPTAGPNHSISLVDLRNALTILVGGGLLGIVSFAWMSSHFPVITGTHRLVLRETNASLMPEHLWPSVGDVGLAVTDLKPGGIVQLPDHTFAMKRIDVVSKRGFIAAGSRVVVTEVVGHVIAVRADPDSTPPDTQRT